ncbi:hypothetical protein [Pedobacter psychroterrae]|uniref:Uncharacterized protein n=1 Tax=Pedobacter psychroterrae TaxID=2530453 RepID=A0A4R0NJF4_9SPHI|nr:hypothetical protein [Pedobacter psychroterrae]TCC99947.1 hypothetical protein EZ437_17055 [Pedobacter psychroterrae]
MKYFNLIILLSSLILMGQAHAQEKSNISEKLSMKVPDGAQKVKELKNTNTFSIGKISILNPNNKSGEIYMLDKAAIQIYYFEEKVEKNRLTENKKSFDIDFISAKAKNTACYIKKINDYEVLVGIYEFNSEKMVTSLLLRSTMTILRQSSLFFQLLK